MFYCIPDTDLRMNVYVSGDGWYLSRLKDGVYKPLSPREANYGQYPSINSMGKLSALAVWVRDGNYINEKE